MVLIMIILVLLTIITLASLAIVILMVVGQRWKLLWKHIGMPIFNYFFTTTLRRITLACFSAIVHVNASIPLLSAVLTIRSNDWETSAGFQLENPISNSVCNTATICITLIYLGLLFYEFLPKWKLMYENHQKKQLLASYTNQLASCPYQFKGDYNIKRSEIDDLISWIKSTADKKSEDRICLLTGTAGLGKTVVLHDLLAESATMKTYVVYGIKADQIDFANLSTDEFVNLYVNQFEKVIQEGKEPVLLIDQIDALSKTLSADRKPISLLDTLIGDVLKIKKTRVIVSCRPFDLDFDPLLKKYKYKRNIALRPLDYIKVTEVLTYFDRQIPAKESKTAAFLQIPINLQWFLEYGHDGCEVISLQTLMDEMWTQRITDAENKPQNNKIKTEKLEACLTEVVRVMSESSSLTFNRKRLEKAYDKELSYLVSEHILIIGADKRQLMFPHQTLADYVSARVTYDTNQKMSDILEKEHQGLYVRNRVKQYFAYIREADPEAYNKELTTIIVNDTEGVYRVHIKMLLLTTIAGFDMPNEEEKAFVGKYILEHPLYRDMFIDAIYNKEWYEFVAYHQLIKDAVRENNQEIVNLLKEMSRNVIIYAPDTVATFLLTQIREGDIDWNRNWMEVVNYYPHDSVIKKLEPLYESACGEEQLKYNNYLEKLAGQDYDYVEQKLIDYVGKSLEKQMEHRNDEDFVFKVVYLDNLAHSLLEKLFKEHKERCAETYLKTICKIDDISRIQPNVEVLHQESHAYYLYNSHSYYENHSNLVADYLGYATPIIQKEPDKIRKKIREFLKDSRSIIFYIGLRLMKENPIAYKEEIYHILINKAVLEELDSNVNYLVAILLQSLFPHLNEEEQALLLDIITSVDPEWERTPFTFMREHEEPLYRIGRRKQELLSVIPTDYLRENRPEDLKFLEEKDRELHKVSIREPFQTHMESGWSAHHIDKMRAMSKENMLKAFRKYNSNEGFCRKPTRQGECMNFEALATENPEKYSDVISSILDDKSIDREYAAYGINGLKKANYDITVIKALTDRLCQELLANLTNQSYYHALMDVLRDIKYFIVRDEMTHDMMSLLLKVVSEYPEESYGDEDQVHSTDVYNIGINRVRGSAAHQLTRCDNMTDYKDQIFDALETCVNGSPATRGAIILEQALLNNLDIDRNFRLYMGLVADLTPSLVRIPLNNLHPLVYFINCQYEDQLIPFFKRLFDVEESYEMLTQLLWIAWARKKEWGGELLKEMLDKSENAKYYILHVFNKTHVNDYYTYVRPVVGWCVDSEDSQVGKMMDFLMNDIDELPWKDMRELIDCYSSGKSFAYAGHNFLDLMDDHASVHPEDVLRWMCKLVVVQHRDEESVFNASKMMSVIVAAYNAIRKYDKSNSDLEKALDAMDQLLADKEVRRDMKRFLFELDN